MTKAQIMSALAEKTGLAKKEVVAFMDTLSEMAYAEVKKNGEFVLPGFGKMVKVLVDTPVRYPSVFFGYCYFHPSDTPASSLRCAALVGLCSRPFP